MRDFITPTLNETFSIFGLVFSRKIYLTNNQLMTIEPEALQNLYGSLIEFHVLELSGSGYTWPLTDMEKFTILDNIGIVSKILEYKESVC